jgi:beta-lactamase class A
VDHFDNPPRLVAVVCVLWFVCGCRDSTHLRAQPHDAGPPVRAHGDAQAADAQAADAQVLDAQTRDAQPGHADDDDAGASAQDAILQSLLDWVLDTIQQGGKTSAQALEQHVSPQALSSVPTSQFMMVFTQLAQQLNPFHVTQQVQLSAASIEAQLDTAAGPWVVTIGRTHSAPFRISTLQFKPGLLMIPPKTYDQAMQQLRSLAPGHALLVAEVVDGACQPIAELDTTPRMAIGSAFKLWVLLALDSKLRADSSVTWDSQLAIRDALKSLPSGMFQDEPAGTQFTLRKFADQMISVSDNTAADHMIDFVGRSAVEAAQHDSQHSDPSANIPWLDTRQAFALKFWASAELLSAYRNADAAGRAKLLDQLQSLPIDTSKLADYTAPRALDIEWFASARDLCQVLATLGTRANFDTESELFRVLSINSGLPFDTSDWPFIAYKGGSELGVINLSWLLHRADGRWFSVVLTLNDASNPLDEDAATTVAMGVAQILAAQR